MATQPYTPYPTVAPTTSGGDRYQRIGSTPEEFGAGVGAATERLGQGSVRFGRYLGQVAADEAANQFQDESNKILRGDPNKTNPDGTPDTGFLGLKGKAAMDARPQFEARLEDLRSKIAGKMLTPEQQFHYDQFSRRMRSWVSTEFSNHAVREQDRWIGQTNLASAKLALDHISNNYENPTEVLNGASDLTNAYVKMAEHSGAQPGDPVWQEAQARAKRDALKAQIEPIAVRDPSRAMRMLDKNRTLLGTEYDNLVNRVRARADQQDGREFADDLVKGAPPPNGNDAAAVVKHFEGFAPVAKRDSDGKYRAGFGSDTVTTADGKVLPVTADTRVTQEDAERDLARRLPEFQKTARNAIGAQKWDALSPEAQASLTSLTYNAGHMPDSVARAALTGSEEDIAKAIRSLPAGYQGVNRGRRASEAANIAPIAEGVEGGIRPRAEVLNEILNDPRLRDRPQAQAAAAARVNHIYATYDNAQIKQQAQFKQRVEDSVAEAQNTGTTATPLTQTDFVRHLGPDKGAAQYADYQNELQFGADWKNLQTMSGADQQQFLASRTPTPGQPGYAHAIKLQGRLEKAVQAIQKARNEDPAGSVSQMDAVREAQAGVRPNDAASFQHLVQTRLEAQRALGIPDDAQAPLTKAEAMQMTAPLARVLPGQEAAALEKVASQFREAFGDRAPQAFAYALSVRHQHGEAAAQAADLLLRLSRGEPITADERRQARDAEDQRRAQQAAPAPTRQLADRPPRAQPRVIGNPDETDLTDPSRSSASYPTPTSIAIQDLFKGGLTPKQFDSLYGPGATKRLQDQFPGLFHKPGK